jgi:hypothetical protein
MVLKGRFQTTEKPYRYNSPFHYLRFSSGEYGRHKLEQLAHLQNHSDAERIRNLAAAAIKLANPWESTPTETPAEALAKMVIYPKGRTLDLSLAQLITAEIDAKGRYLWMQSSDRTLVGLFVDLNAASSGSEEFVLLEGGGGVVYQMGTDGWRKVGQAYEQGPIASQKDILASVARGDVSIKDPSWKELWIGTHRIRVQ